MANKVISHLNRCFFEILVILIFFLSGSKILAQGDQSVQSVLSQEIDSRAKNGYLQTNEIQGFGIASIDKYTGTANINIPLYEINLDGLIIPLSISYNTSGIRVNQESGMIGLGWNLIAEAVITNEINGFEDTKDDIRTAEQPHGYLITPNFLDASGNLIDEALLVQQNQSGEPYDTEPDIYTVSLFGKHVVFTLKKQNSGIIRVKALNDPKIDISYDMLNSAFTIVDDNGFIYVFDKIDYFSSAKSFGRQYGSDVSDATQINLIGEGGTTNSAHQIEQDRIAWHLSKVSSPLGNYIDFNYSRSIHLSYPSISEQLHQEVTSLRVDNGVGTPLINPMSNWGSVIERTASTFISEIVYLTSIQGSFGFVEFIPSSRSDLFSESSLKALGNSSYNFMGFLDLFDPTKFPTPKYTGIIIKDQNKEIKRIQFEQSYFNNDKLATTNKEEFLRLKLDAINIGDRRYSFEYFNGGILPKKSSRSVDFWGFYNGTDVITGSDNAYLIPRFGRFHSNYSNTGFIELEEYLFFNSTSKRNSYFYFGKQGLLETVHFPTGGSTQYVYEGNKITVAKPEIYIPQKTNIGTFQFSNLENSDSYNWIFQYLKFANDPNFIFTNQEYRFNCSYTSTSINGEFIIDDGMWCAPNVQITTNVSCAMGDCYSSTGSPSGDAVWIEDVNSGQVVQVLRRHSNVANNYGSTQHNLNLPNGRYRIKTYNWTRSSPQAVVTASASGSYNTMRPDANTRSENYEEFEVGGARIAQLIDRNESGSIIQKRNFQYEYLNPDGNMTSSGVLMDQLVFHSKNVGFFEYTPEYYYGNSFNLHSHNAIRTRNSAKGSHIGYSRVIENLIANDGIGNSGKIITRFYNDPNEYHSRDIGTIPVAKDATKFVNYGSVYLLGAMPISFSYRNGLIISDSIFDSNNELKRRSNYQYNFVNSSQSVIKDSYGKFPHISYQMFIMNCSGNPLCGYFPELPYYKVLSNSDLLENKIALKSYEETVEYFQNGESTNTVAYYYENPNHLLPTKIVKSGQMGKFYTTVKKYPYDVAGWPYISNLVARNELTPVIDEIHYVGTVNNLFEEKLGEKIIEYDLYSGKAMPSAEISYKGITGEENLSISYDKYDNSNGKLLQYSGADQIPITIIWGYNKRYPIATIKGATYNDVASYITNLQALSNSDNDHCMDIQSCNEKNLRNSLNNLRMLFPNAIVTTSTYDPLIGITSHTNAAGYTIYYTYDDDLRLLRVIDKDGNTLKEYSYNYKN